MHDPLIAVDRFELADALAAAGRNEHLRDGVFAALRQAQRQADDPETFRDEVRWPIIAALLRDVDSHRVVLQNGLVYEITPDSRIEQALLLSSEPHPDHVWEPQTTKLLVALGADTTNVLVGGAYIGDQVLSIARAMAGRSPDGRIHAFEPMQHVFERLLRHLELNAITNVTPRRLALWDTTGAKLRLEGPAALAASVAEDTQRGDPQCLVESVTIDDYVQANGLDTVGLIMLDTEGGEERALRGAHQILSQAVPNAPHLVFEIHRSYVDWSMGLENTAVVNFVQALGYTVFAIRDFHNNYPMAGKPIEVIPVDRVYLEGPPHGFNLLATKETGLVTRLQLRVVEDVSPKLLVNKDPALHHPLDGLF